MGSVIFIDLGNVQDLLGRLENEIFLWNGKKVFITKLHQSYQFCSISKTPEQGYQWEINLVLQGKLSAVHSLYQQGFLCCLQSWKSFNLPVFVSLQLRDKHGPVFAQQLYWLTVQIRVWNNISTHHTPDAFSKRIPVWNQPEWGGSTHIAKNIWKNITIPNPIFSC